jgi:hypothetical protein
MGDASSGRHLGFEIIPSEGGVIRFFSDLWSIDGGRGVILGVLEEGVRGLGG